MYEGIKHLHVLVIVLTFIVFIVNFALMMKESDAKNNKFLKIAPHALYTLFIITAAYLVYSNPLGLYPFVSGWASSKLAGFVAYLLSITFALKWAKNNLWRIIGFVSAVFWFLMTIRLAYADRLKTKHLDDENASLFDSDVLSNLVSTAIQSLV